MRWNTLSATTTTTNRKPMWPPPIHISKKDSEINDEIEKLRHSATAALSERRDVIIVASVSCIYGLGSPVDYESQCCLSDRNGEESAGYFAHVGGHSIRP